MRLAKASPRPGVWPSWPRRLTMIVVERSGSWPDRPGLATVGAGPACRRVGRRTSASPLSRRRTRHRRGPSDTLASGGNPAVERLASALIRLPDEAFTANQPLSQTAGKDALEQVPALAEPARRFFEKVEWSGTRPSSPRRQNQRYARFRWTSSHRRRSERMPEQ